jgi:hypothetical protein
MVISNAYNIAGFVPLPPLPTSLIAVRPAVRIVVLLSCLLLMGAAVYAQATPAVPEDAEVISGVSNGDVFGLGHSIRITGTVKKGAISFGGDVIVEGTVDGDVAAIGGSVVQLPGSRINGDVIVIGGTYKYFDVKPNRNDASSTVIYTGYEQELREIMRNPTGLLAPHWSASYIGLRLLAILFWFIVSLALTAAMPGTISRGVARLQLTLFRVAIIGFVGAAVIGAGVPFCLHYLPTPISAVVGVLALLLILIAALFGRVVIYAATGRWLQRKYFKVGQTSESVALLLGTSFWILLSSIPYVWPLAIAVLMVASLGLALTARYRVGWKRKEA